MQVEEPDNGNLTPEQQEARQKLLDLNFPVDSDISFYFPNDHPRKEEVSQLLGVLGKFVVPYDGENTPENLAAGLESFLTNNLGLEQDSNNNIIVDGNLDYNAEHKKLIDEFNATHSAGKELVFVTTGEHTDEWSEAYGTNGQIAVPLIEPSTNDDKALVESVGREGFSVTTYLQNRWEGVELEDGKLQLPKDSGDFGADFTLLINRSDTPFYVEGSDTESEFRDDDDEGFKAWLANNPEAAQQLAISGTVTAVTARRLRRVYNGVTERMRAHHDALTASGTDYNLSRLDVMTDVTTRIKNNPMLSSVRIRPGAGGLSNEKLNKILDELVNTDTLDDLNTKIGNGTVVSIGNSDNLNWLINDPVKVEVNGETVVMEKSVRDDVIAKAQADFEAGIWEGDEPGPKGQNIPPEYFEARKANGPLPDGVTRGAITDFHGKLPSGTDSAITPNVIEEYITREIAAGRSLPELNNNLIDDILLEIDEGNLSPTSWQEVRPVEIDITSTQIDGIPDPQLDEARENYRAWAENFEKRNGRAPELEEGHVIDELIRIAGTGDVPVASDLSVAGLQRDVKAEIEAGTPREISAIASGISGGTTSASSTSGLNDIEIANQERVINEYMESQAAERGFVDADGNPDIGKLDYTADDVVAQLQADRRAAIAAGDAVRDADGRLIELTESRFVDITGSFPPGGGTGGTGSAGTSGPGTRGGTDTGAPRTVDPGTGGTGPTVDPGGPTASYDRSFLEANDVDPSKIPGMLGETGSIATLERAPGIELTQADIDAQVAQMEAAELKIDTEVASGVAQMESDLDAAARASGDLDAPLTQTELDAFNDLTSSMDDPEGFINDNTAARTGVIDLDAPNGSASPLVREVVEEVLEGPPRVPLVSLALDDLQLKGVRGGLWGTFASLTPQISLGIGAALDKVGLEGLGGEFTEAGVDGVEVQGKVDSVVNDMWIQGLHNDANSIVEKGQRDGGLVGLGEQGIGYGFKGVASGIDYAWNDATNDALEGAGQLITAPAKALDWAFGHDNSGGDSNAQTVSFSQPDTDGDGTPDSRDPDSRNYRPLRPPSDSNNNGTPDWRDPKASSYTSSTDRAIASVLEPRNGAGYVGNDGKVTDTVVVGTGVVEGVRTVIAYPEGGGVSTKYVDWDPSQEANLPPGAVAYPFDPDGNGEVELESRPTLDSSGSLIPYETGVQVAREGTGATGSYTNEDEVSSYYEKTFANQASVNNPDPMPEVTPEAINTSIANSKIVTNQAFNQAIDNTGQEAVQALSAAQQSDYNNNASVAAQDFNATLAQVSEPYQATSYAPEAYAPTTTVEPVAAPVPDLYVDSSMIDGPAYAAPAPVETYTPVANVVPAPTLNYASPDSATSITPTISFSDAIANATAEITNNNPGTVTPTLSYASPSIVEAAPTPSTSTTTNSLASGFAALGDSITANAAGSADGSSSVAHDNNFESRFAPSTPSAVAPPTTPTTTDVTKFFY